MARNHDDEGAGEHPVLFEHAADGVFVTDSGGRYLYANERGLAQLGYSLEELRDLRLEDVRAEEDANPPPRIAELRGGEVITSERLLQRKDGTRFTAEISAAALPDGRLLGLVRDVTERKRMESELRDSEERYRTLVEGSNLGLLIFQDGRIVFANRVFSELVSYGRDELLAMGPGEVLDLVHPEDRELVAARIRRRLEGADVPTRYEFRVLSRSGEVRWLDVSSNLVQSRGRPALQTTVFDVTERKAAEERLARTQKLDAVGRLAGGVAHDFNNILSVIMAESSMAAAKLDRGLPAADHLREIERSTWRAAELTRQLLSFSRHQLVEPTVLPLAELVYEAIRMLRRVIGEDIELGCDLDPDTGTVWADKGQLEQLLVNLAVNARDAMPRGGRLSVATRRRRVEPRELDVPPGDYAELVVTDTGVGMTDEVKKRLFEPFFTTKEPGRGTGLGLATCYGIVKRFGGDIRVESEERRGTSFQVLFPQAGLRPPASARAEPAPASGGSETILLVEDEEALRRAVSGILVDQGYQVVAASSAEEALKRFEGLASDPSLLLTDMVLPGMSGAALADRIAERTPDVRVLVMSGYSAEEIHDRRPRPPRLSTIAKPFTPTELTRRIREALE